MTLANGHETREAEPARAPAKAIFLYNADSGPVAASREVECSLGFPSVYYHRDEMPKDVAEFVRTIRLRLPAVLFAMTGGGFVTAVTAGELDECRADPRRLRDRIEAARVRLASLES